jgi:predicted transcriptional regulator
MWRHRQINQRRNERSFDAVTAAIFALAGVVLGALIGGAIQLSLQQRREKRELRIACRLLEYEMIVATGAIEGARKPSFDRDLRGQLSETAELAQVWSEHRQVLAAELAPAQWGKVAFAVLHVWLYINTSPPMEEPSGEPEAKAGGSTVQEYPPDSPFLDQHLSETVSKLREAMDVLAEYV